MQDIRGAPQTPEPQRALHHIRHQSAVRLRGSALRLVMSRLSEVDEHVRAV